MSTRAFLLLLVRCSAAGARPDWERWWEEVHATDLTRLLGATAVERWRADAADPVAHTGTGWTDAAFVHLPADDAVEALERLEGAWPDLWADGRIHERHVLNGVEAFTGHGPSGTLPPPDPDRTGRILAMVRCTDPGRSAEWDRWYEDQHLPDMLATGAFAAGSRWRRERPPTLAPAHATLYDVAGIPLADAVARSAAAMPGLVAAGRKPSWHTGGLTLTLVPG
jgi:hypothetical protein